jgi:hypothetical protein
MSDSKWNLDTKSLKGKEVSENNWKYVKWYENMNSIKI